MKNLLLIGGILTACSDPYVEGYTAALEQETEDCRQEANAALESCYDDCDLWYPDYSECYDICYDAYEVDWYSC